MKRALLIHICILISLFVHGQGGTSSQYMFNPLPLNPGFTGYFDVLSASSQFRFQSLGVEGAPSTQSVSVHSPLRGQHAALGVNVWTESQGVLRNTGFTATYAYRIKTQRFNISFGLHGGIKINENNFSTLSTRQANDPAFDENIRQSSPSLGTGLFLHNSRAYLGFSLPEMIESRNIDTEERPFIIMGGYTFYLSPDVQFNMNGLLRVVEGELVENNINGSIVIQEVLGVGISLGFNNMVSGLVQLVISDRLRLGYVMDIPAQDKINLSGSHEVGLHYLFKKSRKNSLSPRYF